MTENKLRCFFNNNLSTLLYFFDVTGPILLVNLILFGLFAKSLCCGVWSQDGRYTAISGQRKNFKRVSIMFFSLGIPWICDLIGFILVWLNTSKSMPIYIIQTILNLVTASQGIILFLAVFLFSDAKQSIIRCISSNSD